MKEIKAVLNPAAFPNTYVTDSEKNSPEFGLSIGQSIQYEWFRKDSGASKFYNRWDDFHRLRLYARGEQSVAKYKKEIATNGDLSYLNLDWTPVPIIPKFMDVIVNGMADRLYKVKAYAQDAMSAEKRNQYQDTIEADMVSKDLLGQINKDFGINGFNSDPEDLPENDEELQLHMQLKYKPAIEKAEEVSINTILDRNKYSDTRKRIIYDIASIGIGMAKHEFLPGDGIKAVYVDPAQVVHSYTEDPNFNDVFYWGEVKTVNVGELYKIDQSLTKENIDEIKKIGASWDKDHNTSTAYKNSVLGDDNVTLLYFNYKTQKKIVYKKKIGDDGSEKVIEKTDDWDPPMEMMEERGFEKMEKVIDVWYDGVMVLGSNILLKWELSENMVRPKSASQNALSNYVAAAPRMYKGVIESHLKRMIPFANLIQIVSLKLQQVIQKVVPDGVFIDADGINSVDLGNGAKYTPKDALDLYFQTGSVIGRSLTEDGEFNHAKIPIQELNKNSGQSKITSLISSYNHYLNMLRDVTGLNQASDASTPDPDSLVGLQKMAALNSNTATRHILDAVLDITRDLSTALSFRISDALEYSEFKEELILQLGKYNVDLLDDISDLPLHDFAIFIEMAPDEEEQEMLEQNIKIALNKESITLEDAIDVREVRNIKTANSLLKVRRKKREKEVRDFEMQKIDRQNEANQAAQQMAAQIAAQKIQLETDSKMRISQAETGFKLEELRGEAEIKKGLMLLEFDLNMQLKGVELDKLNKIKQNDNNDKTKRQDRKDANASKMIEQRRNNAPPIDFESSEDTLDGFDLAEFEPR